MSKQKLEMTFDPTTIEHLGIQMYSTLPPVIAELIANAHDADAPIIEIWLKDDSKEKEIIVSDKGSGMSFDDINDKFLRIGRNRRLEEKSQTTEGGRKIIGKKGLGKLSFFGIASEIKVTTKKAGKENSFLMNWEKIKHSSDKVYKPDIIKSDEKCSPEDHGTQIILRGLHRETPFDPEALSIALSKIFIVDSKFKVIIKHNSASPILVQDKKKYEELEKEVEWNVPKEVYFPSDDPRYLKIKGHLIATIKPIPSRTNMRGVTLFSRKKLVNEPEYFSESTSSHFFSYLTGWLEVDFIDDLDEDVIATDRQSLRWGHPEMEKLREHLRKLMNWLEQDWRKKRAVIREKDLAEKTGINIPDWFSKLPIDIKNLVEPILKAVVNESELPMQTINTAAMKLRKIVPDYPKYHWRHLHTEIKIIANDDYINGRYFDAAEKATRLYIQKVKDKSGVDSGKDDNDMDIAFNTGNGKLMVTTCDDPTKTNIQSGQHLLSKGVVFGFRNPLAHNPEYQKKLVDTGLFSEKDCLDILSLVSHLFGRLDNAQKRK